MAPAKPLTDGPPCSGRGCLLFSPSQTKKTSEGAHDCHVSAAALSCGAQGTMRHVAGAAACSCGVLSQLSAADIKLDASTACVGAHMRGPNDSLVVGRLPLQVMDGLCGHVHDQWLGTSCLVISRQHLLWPKAGAAIHLHLASVGAGTPTTWTNLTLTLWCPEPGRCWSSAAPATARAQCCAPRWLAPTRPAACATCRPRSATRRRAAP